MNEFRDDQLTAMNFLKHSFDRKKTYRSFSHGNHLQYVVFFFPKSFPRNHFFGALKMDGTSTCRDRGIGTHQLLQRVVVAGWDDKMDQGWLPGWMMLDEDFLELKIVMVLLFVMVEVLLMNDFISISWDHWKFITRSVGLLIKTYIHLLRNVSWSRL